MALSMIQKLKLTYIKRSLSSHLTLIFGKFARAEVLVESGPTEETLFGERNFASL